MDVQDGRDDATPRDPRDAVASTGAGPADVAPEGTEDAPSGPDPRVVDALEEPLPWAMGAYEVPADEDEAVQADGDPAKTPDETSGEDPASVPGSQTTDGVADEGTQAGGTTTPTSRPRRGPRLKVAGARHRKGGTRRTPKGSGVRTVVGEEEDRDRAKARKGALFMAVILAISLLWIVVSGQFDEFTHALNNVEGAWVAGGILCMVAYFLLGSLAYVLAAYIDPDSPLGIRDCMSVEASGTFFGNLTPMSSGAVPAQIYRLTQAGLEVGEASATQFTRFIIYQAGEVVVAALMIVLELDYFLETFGNIVLVNVVVFIIQTLQVLGLLAVCLMPRLVIRVGNWAVNLAHRHGWLDDERSREYLHVINTQVTEFAATFKASFRHRKSLLLTMVVTFLQLCSFYMVPWFVLHAFGGQGDFLICLAGGSMVQMIGNSVPLPGGTGGNEAGFALFFGAMFGPTATAGFIVWRLITFYLPTILCLPLTGMRSSHRRSIYQRWNAFRRRQHQRARYRPRRR